MACGTSCSLPEGRAEGHQCYRLGWVTGAGDGSIAFAKNPTIFSISVTTPLGSFLLG